MRSWQVRFLLTTLIVIGLLFTVTPSSFFPFTVKAWLDSPDQNTEICTYTSNQVNPAIVDDGTGGAIIVWQDYRGGTAYDIYAQRVDSNGDPQWTEYGVAICTSAGDQISLTIVDDGTGGAIIAWQDYRSGTTYDIYAQRVDSDGIPKWTASGVSISTAAGNQENPTIVTDGAGGAIIAWQDYRNANYDIYSRRVDSDGDPQWTEYGVAICTESGDQMDPTLVGDGTGGAIITWRDNRNGSNDIYVRRITSNGVPKWTEDGVAICTAVGDQWGTTLADDGSGGAIVSWQDYRNSNDYDIYVRKVDTDGIPQWASDGVAICTATGDQRYPIILSDGAGGAIITWRDKRDGSNYDIYAHRVGSDGVPQWASDGVAICTTTGDQMDPTLVGDGAGGAIIAWRDKRNGSNYDIYARKVNIDGILQWSADGVICSAANDQWSPIVVGDGSGGAIISWQDYRNGTEYDIYAQRISMFGSLMNKPFISSLDVDHGNHGQTFDVNIHGEYLVDVETVSFGSGITTNDFNAASNTQITANLSINNSALTGTRSVAVTTPGGIAILEHGFTVINSPPSTPGNISPDDFADNVSLTPILEASIFSDPEEDSHYASEWEVTTEAGDYDSPVWESGSDKDNLTSIAIPASELSKGVTYYWHVRYQDDYLDWSNWSTETSFATFEKVETSITLQIPDCSDNVAQCGETLEIVVNLVNKIDNTPLSGKNIVFTTDIGSFNKTVGITDENGQLAVQFIAPELNAQGEAKITAEFAGDIEYGSSIHSTTVAVKVRKGIDWGLWGAVIAIVSLICGGGLISGIWKLYKHLSGRKDKPVEGKSSYDSPVYDDHVVSNTSEKE